ERGPRADEAPLGLRGGRLGRLDRGLRRLDPLLGDRDLLGEARVGLRLLALGGRVLGPRRLGTPPRLLQRGPQPPDLLTGRVGPAGGALPAGPRRPGGARRAAAPPRRAPARPPRAAPRPRRAARGPAPAPR